MALAGSTDMSQMLSTFCNSSKVPTPTDAEDDGPASIGKGLTRWLDRSGASKSERAFLPPAKQC